MTLKVAVIPVTPLEQNCTIMWDEDTMTGVVIDPGGDVDALKDAIDGLGLKIEKILLTHGHFDHVGGAMKLAEKTEAPIIGPHKDDEYLTTAVTERGPQFGITDGENITGNSWLAEGDQVSFGAETLDVYHTPGHTPGHIIFVHKSEKIAQVGDVLFKGSIGRTDFDRSNHQDLINSITQKLWPLGDDVTFIPGHGPAGTFGEERATNPFVSDDVVG